MSKVTIIEPTINPITNIPIYKKVKRRVAAYARVSTDSDEQYTSYETQVEYYTNYIKSREDWEYINTYADEGISGTNRKKRAQFNKMISDALAGKIDLIITKSISRFARNTLDTISIIRELKSHHIEVFFEKENIWTLDSKSEVILTIMASLAQEESRSISENVKWGLRKTFEKGKVSFSYSNFLGYKKGEDGKIEIDEEEAQIVRDIYTMFLIEGMTASGIAVALNEKYPRDVIWRKNRINSILTNEKYKGDALLQKTYVSDFLEHKIEQNIGVLPKYYVNNSHKPIINPEEWDLVQFEKKRRDSLGATYSSIGPFCSKLICGDCGSLYGRKVWHSGTIYQKEVYMCNHRLDGKKGHKCRTSAITEEEIKSKFLKAYTMLMDDRDEIISNLKEVIDTVFNVEKHDKKLSDLKFDLDILEEKVKSIVAERGILSSSEFEEKYNEINNAYNKTSSDIRNLLNEKENILLKRNKLLSYIYYLENEPKGINAWNKQTWMVLVELAIVNIDKSITFKFYGGNEITVK